MSFHLSQTPTLEAVANEDEKLLAQDLQARVAEAVQQAQDLPEVVEATQARTAAAEHLAKLRAAERALTQQAKESRERTNRLSQTLLDALVESAAASSKAATSKAEAAKPEARKFSELASLENRVRYTGLAIARLTEHLVPLAQIASLREEAHALLAEARATERLAQERAEKVLGQMRDAVSDEMVLPVDMSKGVAGTLLARARSLKARAVQVSENADQLERAYQDRYEH